jgi:hypothetical protein
VAAQTRGPGPLPTERPRPDGFRKQEHFLNNLRDSETQEISLAAYHRALPEPTDDEIRWLLDQGIDGDAMALPYAIRSSWVRFDRTTFDFNKDGEKAIIFRAVDGEAVDLIAWQPRTGKITSWRGIAFCLGDVDQVFCPSTYFMDGMLSIHADPLEWLRADRAGIVIVNPRLTYAHFGRSSGRVFIPELSLAQRFKAWLRPPKSRVKIFTSNNIAEGIAA